jgi:hypothetical protein
MPRPLRSFLLLICLFSCFLAYGALSAPESRKLSAQSPPASAVPSGSSQAASVLQQAFAAMGGALPADTIATGTVTIVAGSLTESGSIRIQTRGQSQSLEAIQAGSIQSSVVYSGGLASHDEGDAKKMYPIERSLSSQSAAFPLPLVFWALRSPDAAASFIGDESVSGTPVSHVRISSTFASKPNLKRFAEFTTRDLWIASDTGLPVKMTYERREGGGSSPHVLVELDYSNYQNVRGVLYPFQILESLNGTPWTTIQISKVNLNTGLADTDFPLPLARSLK